MKKHNTNDLSARCLQCGQPINPSACESGYCPDCRLAEILLKDDRLATDFQGPIGVSAKPPPADNH
jgi:hypothetical protein